ncbi:MAG: ABC transporter permease [Bacteroidia bacterium]|nr:ABC transporter permease [Bacteroidia bacterium]
MKKSFLVMTLLSPILIVLFYGLIFYFSFNKDIAEEHKTIWVNDSSEVFINKIENSKNLMFVYNTSTLEEAYQSLKNQDIYGILSIQKTQDKFSYNLLSYEQPGLSTLSNLESKLENVLKRKHLEANGIDTSIIQKLNAIQIKINTKKYSNETEESGDSGATTIVGFIGAFLIYFFIFLYGVQVMKGVIEEKTNRIVEVIISSVKPFQLMLGKITGIALVGFTQFSIWVLLVVSLSAPVSSLVMNLANIDPSSLAQGAANSGGAGAGILAGFTQINLPLILGMFLFYFIGGYLFYGALFAAVGSAVDNETDTQQFMLPITMPLIFSIAIAQSVINSPGSDLAFYLSIIPFSSPVIMMIRLPFGVPVSEILLSMAAMVAGFLFTTWLAARIYRIGILTFGKKPTYAELFKWLFRKN